MTTVATDSEAFADAHRRLVADPSIQFDLPRAPREEPPAWLEAVIDFIRDNAGVLKPLFYALLIGMAAWLLWILGSALYARYKETRGHTAQPENIWRPQAAAARRLLEEADALAGAGRYGEAARLLLFRSIEDIGARRSNLVQPALTSREIAGAGALPEAARGPFATIAALVERSLFAGRGLDASGWGEARAAYARFAGEGWA